MYEVKIAEYLTQSSTSKTASTFYSEQPFEVSAWSKTRIAGYAYNFGNVDNQLVITVMWGIAKEGEFPFEHGTTASSTTLYWTVDTSLTQTISCGAAITDKVPILLPVPTIQALYMKCQCELSGTSQAVDLQLYHYPET